LREGGARSGVDGAAGEVVVVAEVAGAEGWGSAAVSVEEDVSALLGHGGISFGVKWKRLGVCRGVCFLSIFIVYHSGWGDCAIYFPPPK